MSNELTSILEHLISTPSVNPDQDGADEVKGELRMAKAVERLLKKRGFQTRILEPTSGRPNVVGVFGPEQPRRILAFEGHLDTVSVEGMTIPPFQPEIREGRLYGRGACDTKGPSAAALAALTPERLEALAARGISVLYLGAMGEECGNLGAIEIVEDEIIIDDLIVLEPTDNIPVIAHKGALWARAVIIGQPGHGSSPDTGCNAILAAAKFIQLAMADHKKRKTKVNPLLGHETLNVGRIHGGTAVNIVAGECDVELDCRYLPGQDGEAILHSWYEHIQTLINDGDAVDGHVEVIKLVQPFEADVYSELVLQLKESCDALNRENAPRGSAWYSDAGVLGDVAEAAVVFGPGSIAQAHTRDEFIELDELQKGSEILGRFLDGYGVEA